MTLWVTLDDPPGKAQALVYMLADTVPEMEEQSVGDTWGFAKALVDALAGTLAAVEAVPPGDKLDDAYGLNDLLGDTWRHTKQCAVTGRLAV